MRRRGVLKLSAATAMLATPHIAIAQRERTLKFVPGSDLVQLDPISTLIRPTRMHDQLVFDTLYGLDETFTARPQMVEGHTVENVGTIWTIRLRDGLRFHDGTPVLARDVVASIRRFAARDGFGQELVEPYTPDVWPCRPRPTQSTPSGGAMNAAGFRINFAPEPNRDPSSATA